VNIVKKTSEDGAVEYHFDGWASEGRFWFTGDRNDNGYALHIEITTSQDDDGLGPQTLTITGPNMEIPDFLELAEIINKIFHYARFHVEEG
jgi:hypothetical protein